MLPVPLASYPLCAVQSTVHFTSASGECEAAGYRLAPDSTPHPPHPHLRKGSREVRQRCDERLDRVKEQLVGDAGRTCAGAAPAAATDTAAPAVATVTRDPGFRLKGGGNASETAAGRSHAAGAGRQKAGTTSCARSETARSESAPV